MFSYAPFFLITAVAAGVIGFGAVPSLAATITQAVSILFLVLFVVSLLRGKRTN